MALFILSIDGLVSTMFLNAPGIFVKIIRH